MQPIDSFSGAFRWLSNFEPATVEFAGKLYPTAEHAFQAAKTLDPKLREQIRRASTPGAARALGRRVLLRGDWDEIKNDIMLQLLLDKFTRNVDLRTKLLATGDRSLIESNTWGDTYWGKVNGYGHNHLGKLLMRVREELRVVCAPCSHGRHSNKGPPEYGDDDACPEERCGCACRKENVKSNVSP